MQVGLGELCEAAGGQLAAAECDRAGGGRLLVQGWSIDSRTLRAGDCFIAIKGPNHDGHDHLGSAFANGAVVALVERPDHSIHRPQVVVADTLAALKRLGTWARRTWGRPLVAVTGSAGKTTTKEVIAAMLATRFRVAKTIGNLNNEIGLPLTLVRFPSDAEVGVVELGMNHAGEIARLTAIAAPQVGIVTNVGYAHIENFASVDDIAKAKGELIDGLPPDGTAVLNADDARVLQLGAPFPGRIITFGLSVGADVRAVDVETRSEGIRFSVDATLFHSSLRGRHGVLNILAGLAVGRAFGLASAALKDAVAQLEPGKMRGERIVSRGMIILNDSYNSNPDAVRFMLDVLRDEPARRHIAVLGEMLELGGWAESLHRDVGCYAARSGVDAVIGIRGAARELVAGARDAGASHTWFFDSSEEAGAFLRGFVQPGDAILFKGSRGTQVERALATMES